MLRKIRDKVMGKEKTKIELVELSDDEVKSVTATGLLSDGFNRPYAADLRFQGVKEIIKKIHMA